MNKELECNVKALTASNNCLKIENRQLTDALSDWALEMTILENMSYIDLLKWKYRRNKLTKRRLG